MTPTQELQRPVIKTDLPGPKSLEIIHGDERYVTPSYPRPDYKLVVDRAHGVWVEDPDGNTFLDCNAGVAVCSTPRFRSFLRSFGGYPMSGLAAI